MSRLTAEELLDEQVSDMVAWLRMVMRPVDPAEADPDVYRHWDDDVLELGERVADELLTEWAWGEDDPEGLALVLDRRVTQAAWRATDNDQPAPAADMEPEPLDVEPGTVVWSVPAYAPYVLPMSALRAVTAWMADNQVDNASGAHEVRVEAHPDGTRTIAYQRGTPTRPWEKPDPTVTPARVLLRTDPPTLPELPDLTALGVVLEQHPVGAAHFNMPLPFGSLVCCACTATAGPQHPVVFPCPPVCDAATAAGVEVHADDDEPDRVDEFDRDEFDDLADVPAWALPGKRVQT